MEHRYSPRFSGNMKALIYKSDLPIAIGWLANVSRYGLFIASDYSNASLNQLLEIEFLGDSRNGDSHRRCRAVVVHKSKEGFGLAIDESCPVSCELAAKLVGKYRQRRVAIPALSRIEEAQADSALYI